MEMSAVVRRVRRKLVNINTAMASSVANNLECKTQTGKYHNSRGGHGYAAEDVNILVDLLLGRKVDVTGPSNQKNGPDRIVNGVSIQTKYHQSAETTMKSAFDQGGRFRYTGQQLEVPRDQYEECVRQMRDKISQGQVPGVTDPGMAEKIVKKGALTLNQAKQCAKPGNAYSLTLDVVNQLEFSSLGGIISAWATYRHQIREDVPKRAAINQAAISGAKSSGQQLASGVIFSQIMRTKGAAAGVQGTMKLVKKTAATGLGRKIVDLVATGSKGKALFGEAATRHVAKLARSNVISAGVSTVVSSVPDAYHAYKGDISWKQCGKNVATNAGGAVGGMGGWMTGAAAGAALGSAVPIIGTAVGGVVGGILGAFGGDTLGRKAMKKICC